VSKLKPNQSLETGESLTSPNSCFRLSMQRNGNVVLRRKFDNFVVWQTRTVGMAAAKLIMQQNGNLILVKLIRIQSKRSSSYNEQLFFVCYMCFFPQS
jgi:hypothetical protein